jgi:hypothetical protein
VGSTKNEYLSEDFGKTARRRYHKPTLIGFGLIRDLTASGSGTMDEQSPDCSSNKSFIAGCMGSTARPTRD